MSGPRNLRAYKRGQRLRAEIRFILEQRPPLARPLSAKEIAVLLRCRPQPSVRTIQWHIAAVRREAELAALGAPETLRPTQFIR